MSTSEIIHTLADKLVYVVTAIMMSVGYSVTHLFRRVQKVEHNQERLAKLEDSHSRLIKLENSMTHLSTNTTTMAKKVDELHGAVHEITGYIKAKEK